LLATLGLAGSLLASASGALPAGPPADLVIIRGNVVTVDEQLPRAEALAVCGDRIAAVGTDREIEQWIGGTTRVLDVGGQLVIPGLIDSHAHFKGLGLAKLRLDLTGARSWGEIVALVAEAAGETPPGEWIRGRGWHQEKWIRPPEPNLDGLPYHHALSRAAPDHPVLLTHASGHAVIANAKAMELVGITSSTPDPEGGTIVRDASGMAIGVFREDAEDAFEDAYDAFRAERTQQQTETEMRRIIGLATEACLSKGITTFCDAASDFATIDSYRAAAEAGELGVRLWVMILEENDVLAERLGDYKLIGVGNGHLTVRAVKRIFDGALGSHGAWLLEPYEDLPNSTGLNTEPISVMEETARLAMANGFQLCTHAIGDRANREVLNIYERAFTACPDRKDLRWRIEHAQHLHPQDIPRFGQLGVIASMQTCHCTSDGPWVPKRIGAARAETGAYVWRKLLGTGALICNGTDAPVEDVDPLANFYAAVTRRMANGESFHGEQCLTREEALRSYTINGAYAAFEEDLKGSLTPGKWADVTVIDRDIMTIDGEQILEAEIVYTIVGGEIRYER
jgi:predicted amidohydrolase YtcJ